jgi:hypothetical protein
MKTHNSVLALAALFTAPAVPSAAVVASLWGAQGTNIGVALSSAVDPLVFQRRLT